MSTETMTTAQCEELLLRSGWTQWTEELSDGRKVKLPFWRYEGSQQWHYNEAQQCEYVNTERRYAQEHALRIRQRLLDTEVVLRARRAEAAKKQGITSQSFEPAKGVSAAEAAAREAAAA